MEGADLEGLVEQSRRRLFALLQPRLPVRTIILFDNESSQTDTVIDVETGDRTGLLYDIARALAATQTDLLSAKIITDARRVRDAFYVRRNGGKIENENEQEVVREMLEQVILARPLAEAKGEHV
jgi:[protein-PII] uridylyltransferase